MSNYNTSMGIFEDYVGPAPDLSDEDSEEFWQQMYEASVIHHDRIGMQIAAERYNTYVYINNNNK